MRRTSFQNSAGAKMCQKAGPMNSCTTTKSQVSQYTRLHSYCVRHKDNSISRGLPCREYQNRWPKLKVCNIVKYMAIGCLITKKRHHAEYVIWSTKKGLHGKAKGCETFEIHPTKISLPLLPAKHNENTKPDVKYS
jgi:hypothetical protein